MQRTLLLIQRTMLVIAMSLVFQACATRTASFLSSSVVPGADGKVKIKRDKNNNYGIDLDIVGLAQPERLDPPRTNYVVWMETERDGTKNIGRLTTSSGFMSKAMKSSLETVTPFKPTEILITAEDDATVQYPGSQVVLRTGDF